MKTKEMNLEQLVMEYYKKKTLALTIKESVVTEATVVTETTRELILSDLKRLRESTELEKLCLRNEKHDKRFDQHRELQINLNDTRIENLEKMLIKNEIIWDA